MIPPGPMPSPSGRLLKIVIKASAWLAPDISAPLILPDSIPSGGRFRVPGKLRAFIRHESAPRPSGQALHANDTVSLQAYSERLNRVVPEFSGGVPIIVQYPLQMSAPQYMDCMTKGDEMTVAWLVTYSKIHISLNILLGPGTKQFEESVRRD